MTELEGDFNAADERAVKNRRGKEKRAADQASDDLRFLLSNEAGRRFLWSHLAECAVFRTSFNADPLTFAHNEGRRSVGVQLLSTIIDTDPKAWILMQQEAEKPL